MTVSPQAPLMRRYKNNRLGIPQNLDNLQRSGSASRRGGADRPSRCCRSESGSSVPPSPHTERLPCIGWTNFGGSRFRLVNGGLRSCLARLLATEQLQRPYSAVWFKVRPKISRPWRPWHFPCRNEKTTPEGGDNAVGSPKFSALPEARAVSLKAPGGKPPLQGGGAHKKEGGNFLKADVLLGELLHGTRLKHCRLSAHDIENVTLAQVANIGGKAVQKAFDFGAA